MERERERFVLRKLEEKGWNISAAAVALGIKRSWLYHLIGKYEKLNRAWKAARRKRYADLLGEP